MRGLKQASWRVQCAHMLTLIIVLMASLHCAQVAAYPAAQRVYDAPGGKVVGGVRAGDTVQIKQLETVYRNHHSERWAFITYGDRYTQAVGWVNLDTFRKQPPKAAAPPNNSYPPARKSNAIPATIWDINMRCSKNRRRVIQSCELQMVVDIAQTYDTYDDILDCSAELYWTDTHGMSRVSRQQASQPVSADGNGRHHRLDLYFSFGNSGARNATVENQKCQTSSAPRDPYSQY